LSFLLSLSIGQSFTLCLCFNNNWLGASASVGWGACMLGVLTDVPVCCCKNGYKIGYLTEKNVEIREYL
jgi:hypothetical protein